MHKKLFFLSVLLCSVQIHGMDKFGNFALVPFDNLSVIAENLPLSSLNALSQTSHSWNTLLKHNFDLSDTSSRAHCAVKNDYNLSKRAMICYAKGLYCCKCEDENIKEKRKLFCSLGIMHHLSIINTLKPMVRSNLMKLHGQQNKTFKKRREVALLYAGHPGENNKGFEKYTWYYGRGVDPLLLEVMLQENDISTVKSEDWDFDMFGSTVKEDRQLLKKLFHTFIVNGKKERIDFCDYQGTTALHTACDHAWDESVKLLLNRGANVDCRDNEGNTPLMRICKDHDCFLIDLLSHYDADINVMNNAQETPLTVALQGLMSVGEDFNKIEAIKLLLKKGADVDYPFTCPSAFEGNCLFGCSDDDETGTCMDYMRQHRMEYAEIVDEVDC